MKKIELPLSDEARDILAAYGAKSGRTTISLLREGLQLAAAKHGFKLPDLSPSKDYTRRLVGPSVRMASPIAQATAADLQRIAKTTGQPLSAVVRRALDSFVAQSAKPKSAA